jgi:RNA polymerase sigma factor (sigma-70 family)
MEDCTDSAIIEDLRSGIASRQDRAFRCLYRTYFEMIDRMVCNNSGNTDDTKDIFQDAVLVFFNMIKKPDFQATSALKTLFYSICRNKWLMELRKRKRTQQLEEEHQFIPVEASVFSSLVLDERKQLIVQLLGKLGAECAKILDFYYFRKLKMKEIQAQLKLVSEQVVKNRKSRCMKNLRTMVGNNPQIEAMLK